MIRSVEPRDAERIKEICEAELGHKTTEDLIRRRIGELSQDGHYYIMVFEDDSNHEVLGFLQAEKYDLLYGEKGWNIIALATAQRMRGKGIGRALVTGLEEHARALGDSFVRLNSNVIRTEAHRFYQCLGYLCDKSQKRFIKHLS